MMNESTKIIIIGLTKFFGIVVNVATIVVVLAMIFLGLFSPKETLLALMIMSYAVSKYGERGC